jgi:hypothetical protein
MAGLRKDVDLIFRGEDRASPSIKAVRKSVTDLTGAINEQLSAADRGEGSIDSLAKSYQGLKAAQGDINEIVKLATAYERQTTALAEQNKKVDEAKAKQAQLNAEIAAAESPTKRLLNARDAADRQLTGAVSKQQALVASVRETGAALDAAGGDSKNFANTQNLIRTAAIETARALRDAAAAMDQFKGKQAAGKGNAAAAAELEQFNKLAAGSGLPQGQITFISTLENKLQALQAAIVEDQASMAALNAELGNQGLKSAAASAAVLKAGLDEADQAAARLKATAGFRQMAQEIESGARDISRFGSQMDTNSASAQRFADTIRSILNPTQAASATLDGLDSVLTQAETVTNGAKRRLSEYNTELNNLQSASSGITSIARLIDDFRQQEAAVAAARAEMERAQGDVLQLSRAMQTAETPTQQMATELSRAQVNLEKAGAAFANESSKLNTLDAALKRAGVDTNNLTAAENRLAAAAQRAAAAQTAVASKTTGKGSFLGLNPNEMQNLGFQINDIIVSIASGQAPMRVFLQQGAQIGQIIPGAFSAILRYAGPLTLFAGVFLTLASGMKKASDEAARLKEGAGIVGQLGQGTDVTAQQFANLAAQLDFLGVKADDARKLLVQLAADGLNADQMQAYLDTARAVSEVTGVDLKDALEQVRTSFQGGMEDVLNLQEATGTYSDAELDLIQKLYDQGKADEARATALDIYRQKQEEVANAQRGPWKVASEQLSHAWDNLMAAYSRTDGIQNAKRHLNDLAITAAFVGTLMNQVASGKGINMSAAAQAATGIHLPSSSVTVSLPAPTNPNRRTAAGRQMLAEDREALAIATARSPAEKRAAEAIKVRREAAEQAAKAHLSSSEAELHIQNKLAAFNAQEDQKDAKRDAAAAKRGQAAERRKDAAARAAARRAQAVQNQVDNAEESIQRQLEQMDIAVSKATGVDDLQAKLTAVDEQYAKLFRDIDDFSKKTNGKGLINGKSITQVREEVQANEELLKKYVQLADYEGKIKQLEDDRKAKLEAIADAVTRGTIKPEDGLQQSNDIIKDFAVKIAGVAQDAITFAQAMKAAAGAKPTPELDAFLSKMQTVAQKNSGGTNTALTSETSQNAVDAQMTALNKLVSERNALVEHENNLVQAGLESYSTAQTKIQGFYNATNQLIRDQIALILRLASSWATGTPEQQRAFAALSANLATVGQEAQGTNASFVNLRQHINEILTTDIVGFIDSVAQSFAKLVSGQESVMGFLADIGRAFLMMIANILQTVATLIIEALILDAVDKATGGILKPLLQVMAATVQFRHEGGVVGESPARTRQISPLAFAGAPRYHSGGIAGLAPDERAAILKKGEEVLTRDDSRHRLNGGLNPAPAPNGGGMARAVLAVGDDEIAAAMQGEAGERVTMFHLRRNRATLKQMLNVG